MSFGFGVCACVCVLVRVCARVCACACACVRACACVCAYACPCMCACVHVCGDTVTYPELLSQESLPGDLCPLHCMPRALHQLIHGALHCGGILHVCWGWSFQPSSPTGALVLLPQLALHCLSLLARPCIAQWPGTRPPALPTSLCMSCTFRPAGCLVSSQHLTCRSSSVRA